MAYQDTQQKIQKTLTGRNSGTQITPDTHQSMAETMLNYIQEVENISVSGIEGIAYPDTEPVQPDAANVTYISAVPSNTTYTYKNFANESGSAISITATNDPLFVILFWNKEYWTYLASTSAPHLHISTSLVDSDEEVPSSKAVNDALQDIYKRSNPQDDEGNIVDTNTILFMKENDEYAAVIVDADGNFLVGFQKSNGNAVFANKVPKDIQDAINAAIKHQTAALSALQENVSKELTKQSDNISELQKTLNSEKDNRTKADQILAESLATEESQRKVADALLETKEDAEDKYRRSNPNTDAGEIVDTCTVLKIKENNSYILAFVDSNERVLLAFEQSDGNAVFINKVPKDIQAAIDSVNLSLAARITILELARLNPHIILGGNNIVELTSAGVTLPYTATAVTDEGDVSKDSNFTDIELHGNVKYGNAADTVISSVKVSSLSGNFAFSVAQSAALFISGTGKYKGSDMSFAVVSKTVNCVKASYIGYSADNTKLDVAAAGVQKLVKKSLAGSYNVTNSASEPQYLIVAIPKNGNVNAVNTIVQHSSIDAPQQFTKVDATDYTYYVCNIRHNPGTYNFVIS